MYSNGFVKCLFMLNIFSWTKQTLLMGINWSCLVTNSFVKKEPKNVRMIEFDITLKIIYLFTLKEEIFAGI